MNQAGYLILHLLIFKETFYPTKHVEIMQYTSACQHDGIIRSKGGIFLVVEQQPILSIVGCPNFAPGCINKYLTCFYSKGIKINIYHSRLGVTDQ